MEMPKISIRLPETLSDQLDTRTDPVRGYLLSDVVRDSLTHYYAVLDYERKRLQAKFTGSELSLLADICNGTIFTRGILPLGVLADAEDTEDSIYQKWGVDRDAFLRKLRRLSLSQEAVIVEAIEKYWRNPEDVEDMLK